MNDFSFSVALMVLKFTIQVKALIRDCEVHNSNCSSNKVGGFLLFFTILLVALISLRIATVLVVL